MIHIGENNQRAKHLFLINLCQLKYPLHVSKRIIVRHQEVISVHAAYSILSCMVKCCTVLYSTVLCCTVLCCTVLYCTVLYTAVLYCTGLYTAVLYCTVLYCTVLYCTVLYSAVLYCTVLDWTGLDWTVLYCTVLYSTVLYCTVLYSHVYATVSFVFYSMPPTCFGQSCGHLHGDALRRIYYKFKNQGTGVRDSVIDMYVQFSVL